MISDAYNFIFHTIDDPYGTIEPMTMRMAIDGVGLRVPPAPGWKGLRNIFPKSPQFHKYLLTTKLPVATKLILQILPDSWALRVAVEYRDPYTLPISNHSFFRINGIVKCDRNLKYTHGGLGFKC